MKRSLIVILFTMFFISMTCSAQDEHRSDKYLEGEIEKDSTTAGMNNATLKAMEEWDAEMNKCFKLLMSILDETSKGILKTSQRVWIEYRDKEFKSIDNIFAKKQGTMYTTMAIASKNEIVKTRAQDLKEYYELLSE